MYQAKVQYTSHLHDEGDVCRYCPAPSLGNSRSSRGGGGLSVNMSGTSKRKYLTITTVPHGRSLSENRLHQERHFLSSAASDFTAFTVFIHAGVRQCASGGKETGYGARTQTYLITLKHIPI